VLGALLGLAARLRSGLVEQVQGVVFSLGGDLSDLILGFVRHLLGLFASVTRDVLGRVRHRAASVN
jgi:hypothetical protein